MSVSRSDDIFDTIAPEDRLSPEFLENKTIRGPAPAHELIRALYAAPRRGWLGKESSMS